MMQKSLGELAEYVGGEVRGDAQCRISAVATLQAAGPGQISFLANRRYARHLPDTRASAVILGAQDAASCPVNALVVANPYLAYARIAGLLTPHQHLPGAIHPGAVIDATASIDASCHIGACCVVEAGAVLERGVTLAPGCYIGRNVRLGTGSRLSPGVSIYHDVVIGPRAIIHSGAVIGADGFGFANDHGRWVKVPQLGRVIIGADVEVGANTTIDRGALDDTLIGEGVKLDNQIQIAHNVHIGPHTAIAACVAIAGSTVIGRFCAIGGAAGIAGHLEICDNVQVTAMSLVSKSINKPGVYSSSLQAEDHLKWKKKLARLGRLEDIAERLSALEKQLTDKG
ncbi:MAG: UDP-3-O-(3-hydroxymyristoyl)glucosamine N-acyltransferase [Gammaproteobacteria bacterium RBG_16_57_12]|nr:MAG: UDP-3-O-(3-hydroxymyristoyl)glucosamine N-acyltransferase [Gammaproteobacteria bacterium RBG_16_57_12]